MKGRWNWSVDVSSRRKRLASRRLRNTCKLQKRFREWFQYSKNSGISRRTGDFWWAFFFYMQSLACTAREVFYTSYAMRPSQFLLLCKDENSPLSITCIIEGESMPARRCAWPLVLMNISKVKTTILSLCLLQKKLYETMETSGEVRIIIIQIIDCPLKPSETAPKWPERLCNTYRYRHTLTVICIHGLWYYAFLSDCLTVLRFTCTPHGPVAVSWVFNVRIQKTGSTIFPYLMTVYHDAPNLRRLEDCRCQGRMPLSAQLENSSSTGTVPRVAHHNMW